ncbi:hypothetical protein ACFQNJ_01365 [Hydrogenophaga bisanensis]|uniref:Uncharacterized protein n=1 Tax=Hydrogenophaga bisanensis TaxID=439611 RepID=A0ABW2R3U4_9BURK
MSDLTQIDFEGAQKALEQAVPTKSTLRKEAFAKLLPMIEGAMARRVPQKQVLSILAQFGLTLSAGTFKILLKEAQDNRSGGGAA